MRRHTTSSTRQRGGSTMPSPRRVLDQAEPALGQGHGAATPPRSRHRAARRGVGTAAVLAAATLSACGGGSGSGDGADRGGNGTLAAASERAASGATADAVPTAGQTPTTVRFVSGTGGGDTATPFGSAPAGDDRVQFVTTTSTTTTTTTSTTTIPPTTAPPTTTTTVPPTTTSSTTSTTSTSTTTSTTTTTSSTTLPPTMISCSLAADALFAPGSAELGGDARDDLVALVGGIEDVRSVTITGHTDHRGTDSDNLALSQARAEAAADALIAAGIDPRIITAIGEGEHLAKQGSPTDEEMAADRRVDILIDAEVEITTTC